MRWIGWGMLCVGLVVGLLDLIVFLQSGGPVFRSGGSWWFMLSPDTLLLAQPAIERHILPALWDPIILTVLEQPLALVLAAIGLVILLLARRRRRKGRFFE